MPRFSAALNMLYPEHAPLERIGAAAADGFRAVEFQFPYGHEPQEIAARIAGHGVELVLINTPPGDAPGDRGLAAVPGREADFRAGFAQALAMAEALECPRIHVMAGVPPPGCSPAAARAAYVANLAWATARAAGRTLLIEPINRRDIPGYFLTRQADAHAVVQEVGAENLQVQLDLYHCQIVEGDLETTLRRDLPGGRVGHIQIAGVPHRHEPDSGEVDYRHLFGIIDALGWPGWVGCEYRPRAGTSEGLGWMKALQARPA